MTAKREPCPDCDGLGHLCDEAADHIHEHEELDLCQTCGGRGSVPIETDEPEPEPAAPPPVPPAPDQSSSSDDEPDPGEE